MAEVPEHEKVAAIRAREGGPHGEIWDHIHLLHGTSKELRKDVDDLKREVAPGVRITQKRTGRIQWLTWAILLFSILLFLKVMGLI